MHDKPKPEYVSLCQQPNTTLASVREALNTATLTEADRRPLLAALTTTARVLNEPLAALPADYRTLVARIAKVHPRELGVSRKRLQNLRSDLRRAFEAVGMREPRTAAVLTPAWRHLLELVTGKQDRFAVSRFFRFCSEGGIRPEAVTDDTLTAFRAHIDHIDYCRDPYTVHRKLCRVWNRMAPLGGGWPATTLAVPQKDRSWAHGWDAFPASLRQDTEAWLDEQAGDDPFAETAPMKPLKPQTIATRRVHVRQWASALVHSGYQAADLRGLADLVTPHAFKAAMTFLISGERAASRTQAPALGITMIAVAKRAGIKGEALDRLRGMVKRQRFRVGLGRRGLTEKSQEVLRRLDNRSLRYDLLTFPRRVLADVRRDDRVTREGALRVQTALAVELLTMTAIRRTNLASLHLDRHLRWTRSPLATTVHLLLPAHEVKNEIDLAFELPAETVKLLEVYLQEYRPFLTTEANRHLFPGTGTRFKKPARLSRQISDHIHAETGLTITAHQFRHLAAKLTLEANPVNYEGARQLLGHSSLETTVQHYAGEERAAHVRLYDELILRQREAAVLPIRARGGL